MHRFLAPADTWWGTGLKGQGVWEGGRRSVEIPKTGPYGPRKEMREMVSPGSFRPVDGTDKDTALPKLFNRSPKRTGSPYLNPGAQRQQE